MIRLADLNIDWMPEHSEFVSAFFVQDEADADCVISFSQDNRMRECHGIQFIESPGEHLLSRGKEILCANKDWTKATLYCKQYTDPIYTLPLAAICSRFTAFDTVLLHGSFIDYCGSGIVFTGYSGIGKTTQAQLWQQYFGAEIVNGDKVLIRNFEKETIAYGLPWKGSSPYCVNKKVPLKAIIALRQSQENSIKRLNSVECLEYFMPHIFLPHWDKECLSRALDIFDEISRRVPVWLLECRVDEDAVKITRDAVLR